MSRNESKSRRDAASAFLLLVVVSIIAVLALGFLALQIRPDAKRKLDSQRSLRIYCASGVVQPVEQVIQAFRQKYGASVEIVRIGGSGELAGQIKMELESGLVGGADIYITADDQLLVKGQAEGVYAECLPLAVQKPVITVAATNPLTIKSVRELVQNGQIKFGIASPQAAIGKVIRAIAARDGVLAELEANKTIDSENVMILAQALVIGSLDAAVIWETTVTQINQTNDEALLKISAYADPLNEFRSEIAIGVVANSDQRAECLKFARYLTAPEVRQMAFERLGYSFSDQDP